MLTSVNGVPDRKNVKPGMAHFEGSGPAGKTCKDCLHRGYHNDDGKFTNRCSMFRKLAGGHPAPNIVQPNWKACKYFEQREAKKR